MHLVDQCFKSWYNPYDATFLYECIVYFLSWHSKWYHVLVIFGILGSIPVSLVSYRVGTLCPILPGTVWKLSTSNISEIIGDGPNEDPKA